MVKLSPVEMIYAPWRSTTRCQYLSSTFFHFHSGTQIWQDLVSYLSKKLTAVPYSMAEQDNRGNLAVTGRTCPKPPHRSGFLKLPCWRSHVVKRIAMQRCSKGLSYSGLCCWSISSPGTRRVSEKPLDDPSPAVSLCTHMTETTQQNLA